MICQTAETQIKSKQFSIYDGLLTKKINLASINSTKIIQPQQIVQQIDNDSKINALKYRHPLKYLGKGYEQIVVPCTPAYQLSSNSNLKKQNEEQNFQCWAKVPNKTQTQGIASGKRSAIYLDKNNRLIRLKGCGNEEKGFNRQNNQSRGHHFYHTAKRQLFMTQNLNKIFKEQLNLSIPANKPLYMFVYPEAQINSVNLANDLPLISKYCCVFETQGDRRAGTHLISPLQTLYLSLLDHQKAEWKKSFLARERIDNGELVQLVANFELFMEPNQKFINIYDASKQINNYIQFKDAELVTIPQYKQKLQQIFLKLVPQQFRQSGLNILLQFQQNKLKDTVEVILKKIGYQMGRIKRVMCQHQISWGFYLDHGVQWHCNAHLNNFIVTKPHVDSNSFLLPLDYDLSYSSKEFINIDLQASDYGHYSEDVFQSNLCGEFSAMQMSLFGLEVMNFKYGIQQFQTSQNKRMGRIAFRDTLVKSFNQGMRNKKQIGQQIQKDWKENIENIKKLVEGCLYLSIDFQT